MLPPPPPPPPHLFVGLKHAASSIRAVEKQDKAVRRVNLQVTIYVTNKQTDSRVDRYGLQMGSLSRHTIKPYSFHTI